jgi:hypothetical protein
MRASLINSKYQNDGEKNSIVWRDAAGNILKNEGRYQLKGTDLFISKANWADMGRFTRTAMNGFGVDMVSTFLYLLSPAFYDYDLNN